MTKRGRPSSTTVDKQLINAVISVATCLFKYGYISIQEVETLKSKALSSLEGFDLNLSIQLLTLEYLAKHNGSIEQAFNTVSEILYPTTKKYNSHLGIKRIIRN